MISNQYGFEIFPCDFNTTRRQGGEDEDIDADKGIFMLLGDRTVEPDRAAVNYNTFDGLNDFLMMIRRNFHADGKNNHNYGGGEDDFIYNAALLYLPAVNYYPKQSEDVWLKNNIRLHISTQMQHPFTQLFFTTRGLLYGFTGFAPGSALRVSGTYPHTPVLSRIALMQRHMTPDEVEGEKEP